MALLLISSQVFVQRALGKLEQDGAVSATAHRALSLSQELVREASDIKGDPSRRAVLERALFLRTGLLEWERLQRSLVERSEARGLGGTNSAAVTAMLQKADLPFRTMRDTLRRLLVFVDKGNPGNVRSGNLLIGTVLKQQPAYAVIMDDVVAALQSQHDGRIRAIKIQQFGIASVILLLILAEVIFVIRPAIGFMSVKIEQEARAESEADRAVAERARRSAEHEMKNIEAQFQALFDGASVGMCLLNSDGTILETNTALQQMIGYSDEYLCGKPFANWVATGELPPDYSFEAAFLAPGAKLNRTELLALTKQGREIWVEMLVSPVKDASGQMTVAIGMVQNVSSRHLAFRQLRYEATHDPLTGLANRTYFKRELDLAFLSGEAGETKGFAVLHVDLDHFKFINDSLGHASGDALLTIIGERMRACARSHDVVARLGGDEFAILMLDLADQQHAVKVADRVQRELSTPVDIEGRLVYTTASIGIAYGPQGYENPGDLLRDADTAMYRAKSLGRARFVIFDQGMHAAARERMEVSNDLRAALDNQEFVLFYQPIYELKEHRCAGFEALIRWNHPRLGLVPPNDFIPVAEETGLILPIGMWALREACTQLQKWHQMFPAAGPLFMSVNLSPQQLVQPDFDKIVGALLRELGVDGHHLVLEITESVIVDGGPLTTSVIEGLKALNIRLCIDDFGTGYSSLTYLQRFPIDSLKIDRSFVGGSDGKLQSEQIVSMLVRLGHALGIRVIAEGVEHDDQLASLVAMECGFAQGYLFSKAVDPGEIALLFQATQISA